MYLTEEFELLIGQPLADLPVAELTDRLALIERDVRRLQAERLRITATLDGRVGELDDPSVHTLLRRTCRLTGRQVAGAVALARALTHLPATRTALADGRITLEHAQAIHQATRGLPEDVVHAGEETLLETALALDPADTRRVGQHWRHAADPDLADRDQVRQHRARRLYASPTLDGMVTISGLLDPLSGETVLTALNALAGPRDPGDPRTPAQRRADALVEIAHRALTGGLPTAGGHRPHLQVTVDLPALLGRPATSGADLAWTGAVPAEIARLLGCDATVTRIVLGPDSQPLDVGRATRLVGPALRKALTLRDRHCTWPGCDTPAAWTDAHHLTSWADGGDTALSNLTLLCRRHHRATHQRDGTHDRAGP